MNPIQTAAERFGRDNQLRQLQEECAELIAAINHFLRGRCSEADMLDEMADVCIMVAQMDHFFGDDALDLAVQAKLERLEKRLEEVVL